MVSFTVSGVARGKFLRGRCEYRSRNSRERGWSDVKKKKKTVESSLENLIKMCNFCRCSLHFGQGKENKWYYSFAICLWRIDHWLKPSLWAVGGYRNVFMAVRPKSECNVGLINTERFPALSHWIGRVAACVAAYYDTSEPSYLRQHQIPIARIRSKPRVSTGRIQGSQCGEIVRGSLRTVHLIFEN